MLLKVKAAGRLRFRGLALLAILSPFALLLLAPAAHAVQSATENITITPDNGYHSTDSATVVGTGCSVATIAMDGSEHSFTCNAGTLLTITVPGDLTLSCNPNCRYRGSGGLMTILSYLTDNTAPYSDTNSATVFFELENTYQASTNGQGPPVWDPGLTITPTGELSGAPSNVCTISPTAGTIAVASCTGWSDYKMLVTAQPAASGAGANIAWKVGSSSVYTPTTGGNAVPAFDYYKQLQNTYEVAPSAQPSFDNGLSWDVAGLSLGAQGSLCTLAAADQYKCFIYADYDTTVTFPPFASNSPAFSRWEAGGTSTFAQTNGGNLDKVNYYKQVQEQFSYSVSDGSSGFDAPILLCTQLGSPANCGTISGNPTTAWLDFGSRWTATKTLFGSPSDERWSSFNNTGTASVNANAAIFYYHQFQVTVGYSVIGGGSPSPAPSVSFKLFGRPNLVAMNQTLTPVWMDTLQSFRVSAPLGTASERWRSPTSSFPVVEGSRYPILFYHQYSLVLSYILDGGGSGYSPPVLTFSNFSRALSPSLTQQPTVYWADAGTNWGIAGALAGGSATERWDTVAVDSGVVAGSVTSVLTFYHQYLMSFGSSVQGGGTGYQMPTVTLYQFGAETTGTQGWVDAGSTYSFTNPLSGSTTTERWYSGAGSGTAVGAGAVNATFYHQFAFMLSYLLVSPSSALGAPTVGLSQQGGRTSLSLSPSPTLTWLDAGTAWNVTSTFGASSQNQRWATQQSTSGIAAAPETYDFDFYDQFRVTVRYNVTGGGSPRVPSVAYTAYGSATSAPMSNGSRSLWVDAGSRWALPLVLPGSNGGERWLAQGNDGGTVAAAGTFQVTYQHQYFLQTLPNSALGGAIRNLTSWYQNGAAVRLNASATPGWEFAYWKGIGSGAYNGTEPSPSIALAGPAVEVAEFYPGLTIIISGGGQVLYSTAGARGNASTGRTVVYVPLGSNVSLTATPALFDIVFQGWSEALSGRSPQATVAVGGPVTVAASFGLDYSDLGVIGATVPVIAVLAVYIFVVRRLPRRRV